MHPILLYIWSITNVHCYKIKQSRKKTHRFEVMHVIFVTLTHIIGQDVNGLVKHTQVPNVIRVAMSAHTVVDLFWRQPIFLQALKTEKWFFLYINEPVFVDRWSANLSSEFQLSMICNIFFFKHTHIYIPSRIWSLSHGFPVSTTTFFGPLIKLILPQALWWPFERKLHIKKNI